MNYPVVLDIAVHDDKDVLQSGFTVRGSLIREPKVGGLITLSHIGGYCNRFQVKFLDIEEDLRNRFLFLDCKGFFQTLQGQSLPFTLEFEEEVLEALEKEGWHTCEVDGS